MRIEIAMLAVCVVGSLLCPGIDFGRAVAPEELPDLSVTPYDISLSFYGDPLDFAIAGLPIDIAVTVHNAGPGNSTSANVTLFIDGSFIGMLHVTQNLTAEYPGNASTVHFTWDTTGAGIGNHSIRAVVNDTLGDAAPSDNTAERVIPIYSGPPVLSIQLDPPNLEATVTPDASGTVQFSGTVRVNLGMWSEATVSLSPRMDTGWAAQLAPATMMFTSGEAQYFNVTVVVPPATLARTVGSLRVEGIVRAGEMASTASTAVVVTAKPYYRISVESKEREKDITLGGEAAFTLKVWNVGNAVDSYELKVENWDNLRQAGWEVALDTNSLSKVAPGEYRTLTLMVVAPRDLALYKNSEAVIRMNVTSLNAKDSGTPVSTTALLTVNEKGFNMPCVESLLAVMAVAAAAAGAYFLKRRKRNRSKTVKDYLKELDLDEGD